MKKLLLAILLSATVGMRSSFFSTKNFILPLFLLFFISIHVNAQLVKCSSVSFATATNYEVVGYQANSVAIADLNGDGKLDLAVPIDNANSHGASVGVLLGNGDGTFQPQVNYAAGNGYQMGTVWVAIADVNGDGKLDLAAANSGTDNVSVLLGNGDGTFQAPVIYATGSAPWSVAIGDFNGDGKPDLVTANSGSDNVSVLLGNGDGTFQTQVTYATGSAPWSVAISDFNGDGKPDLAIANSNNWNVSVLLGNGDGTFQTQVTYASGQVTFAHGPYSVAIGDFNGDGKLDLATTNGVSATNGAVGTVSILLGNGDGTFQPQIISEAVGGSRYLAIGDFNGDGKSDLATTSVYYYFSILLGNGDGTFQKEVSYDPGDAHVSVAIGDFNGDGRLDVATGTSTAHMDYVSVLLNNCTASCNLNVSAGPDTSTFFGYTGDQQLTRTAIVSGGTAPYTYSWTLGRPLLCNVITSSGDEIFSGGTGGTCTNTVCPTSGTLTGIATCSGSAAVTVRLVDTTNVCVTVTDSNNCKATSCFRVMAEDVRCFSGSSNISKVNVCHHTSSATNPWVQICIADDAVSAHLANNPGDYLGSCSTNIAYQGDLSITDSSKPGFNIYPNPGNGDFLVSLNSTAADIKGATIQIININGQIIKRINVNEQRELNISLKESGVYFIQLLTNKQILTKKLTVLH